MTREPSKFQIELTDTDNYAVMCNRCSKRITPLEDSEHVIMWAPFPTPPWHFHTDCFEEVLAGMLEFHRVFIKEKQKQQHRTSN